MIGNLCIVFYIFFKSLVVESNVLIIEWFINNMLNENHLPKDYKELL